jgi:hypothetical protein
MMVNKDRVVNASVMTWHCSVLTLRGSEWFKSTDISATRKVHNAEFTKKQATITHCFQK